MEWWRKEKTIQGSIPIKSGFYYDLERSNKVTRKDKSKIICKELRKKIYGFKDNEDVYVAAVMDGLKEIEKQENKEALNIIDKLSSIDEQCCPMTHKGLKAVLDKIESEIDIKTISNRKEV